MTPFQNKDHFLDSARSLSDGCLSTIIDASMFWLICQFDEAGKRTFLVSEWVRFFFRCFAGFESFYVSSYSCHLISTFLIVSPMYDSWQEDTASFVNHTWCMGISTSQFKQLFNFLSGPLDIIFIISENIKLFHETFRELSFR